MAEIRPDKPFKRLTKKELKKCRRELDWADSTGAWLEAQRVTLGINHPEIIHRLAFLRERVKLLRSVVDQMEQIPER